MKRSYIVKKALELVQKYRTRNPFEIADAIGLNIQFADIGNVEGFYTIIMNKRYVILNSTLEETKSISVLAHEIGHDQLHRHFAGNQTLQGIMLYDMKSQPEYEANIFAAALLLDMDQVLSMVKQGKNSQEIASILAIEEYLISICIDCMV